MDEITPTEDNAPTDAPAANDFAPQWGQDAPRGGKAVVNRALKDGSTVPLFLGQTLIHSLRDLGYNSTTSAVCEHVDNALEAKATEIRVYFRQSGKQPKQKIDVLVYDNGCGMAPNTLKVAMAFGGSLRFDSRKGIGRYGMGMKAAALNIARSVDVYSWQEPAAFYSMTLDVDAIGKDRSNSISLPDPQFADTMPLDVATVLTRAMSGAKAVDYDGLLADNVEVLTERLGESGTIVYMPNCDRLSYRTDRTLVDHAIKEMGRVYRRFLDKGVRLYVNNRRVEASDPTYYMLSARHTRVEGLTTTQSKLFDSFEVQIPVAEDSKDTVAIRVRLFLLPIHEWPELDKKVLDKSLHVFNGHTVSYMRNEREVDIGTELKLKITSHTLNAWLRVEIAFPADLDEAFGVAANKQGVRLKPYVANAILNVGDDRFQNGVRQMKDQITSYQSRRAAAAKAGKLSEAERLAGEADALHAVALPPPPTDTPEQVAALEANIRGLATSLRLDNETDEQAFSRVQGAKFLTDLRDRGSYAPFYDTEYRFGKLILRVNTAHRFYQKVWQPLAELSTVPASAGGSDDAAPGASGDAGRRALLGLQLLLMSLTRAQVQMLNGDQEGEKAELFSNLRKSWSDVLQTQLLHV